MSIGVQNSRIYFFCFTLASLLALHLYQLTNNGLAIKIEEYAPEVIPIINANANHFKVSPPKKKSEIKTNSTVTTVEIDLPKV